MMQPNQQSTSPRTVRQSRRGYTLLETMLTLGLTAILMGLVATGLQLYTQVVAGSRADVSNAQIARAVLRVMADDIRATFTEEADDGNDSLAPEDGTDGAGAAGAGEGAGTGEGAGADTGNTNTTATDGETGVSEASVDLTNTGVAAVPGVYGNTTELRLDVRGAFAHPVRHDAIVEAGGDPFVDNLVSVDRVVTYYLRTSDAFELSGTPLESPAASTDQATIFVRRIQKRAEAELDAEIGGVANAQTGEQLLSDRIVAIGFQYHDGLDWTDSWDSELDGLPIAIQVTVTVVADPSDDEAVITEDNIFRITVALPMVAPTEDTETAAGI